MDFVKGMRDGGIVISCLLYIVETSSAIPAFLDSLSFVQL